MDSSKGTNIVLYVVLAVVIILIILILLYLYFRKPIKREYITSQIEYEPKTIQRKRYDYEPKRLSTY